MENLYYAYRVCGQCCRRCGISSEIPKLAAFGPNDPHGSLKDLACLQNSQVAAACFYSSASLRRSAFSATMRWSMQSWMFPSMNAARL